MTNIDGAKRSIKQFVNHQSKLLFPKVDPRVFLGILLFGFGVHSFRITQMLNSPDDIFVLLKGYGAGIEYGRWALEYLGNLVNWKWHLGSFNLSVFNGILSLVFLSLSVCIILELFDLQCSKTGVLFAAVFIVYPVCSATFLYMFTAAYYGLSCLLAVMAAYYIKTKNKLFGLFAIICIAVSMGLYQAYFPVTVTLCLLLVIDNFLKDDADIRTGIKTGVYDLIIMSLGLIVYFLILYNRLEHFGTELEAYKGINSMGEWSVQEVCRLIVKCYDIFLHLPAETYHSINTLQITQRCILVLYIFSIVMLAASIIRRRELNRIIIVPLAFLLPIAVNLIEVMTKNDGIYEVMIYPTVFIFFFPVLLFERNRIGRSVFRMLHKMSGAVVSLILVLTILCYSWHANWNYVALDYMNRETESYFTTLVTRIKSVKNYKDEYQVLFVGEGHFSDKHFENPYLAYPAFYFECNTPGLVNVFSWRNAMSAYTGFQCTTPSEEVCENIYLSDEFKEMCSYPDDGSIKIINEVIVVKISD